MSRSGELLFVYDVDLTLFALVSDFVHRLRDPETIHAACAISRTIGSR